MWQIVEVWLPVPLSLQWEKLMFANTIQYNTDSMLDHWYFRPLGADKVRGPLSVAVGWKPPLTVYRVGETPVWVSHTRC